MSAMQIIYNGHFCKPVNLICEISLNFCFVCLYCDKILWTDMCLESGFVVRIFNNMASISCRASAEGWRSGAQDLTEASLVSLMDFTSLMAPSFGHVYWCSCERWQIYDPVLYLDLILTFRLIKKQNKTSATVWHSQSIQLNICMEPHPLKQSGPIHCGLHIY